MKVTSEPEILKTIKTLLLSWDNGDTVELAKSINKLRTFNLFSLPTYASTYYESIHIRFPGDN